MPDLPALPFVAPTIGRRGTGRAIRPQISGPGPSRQQERLGPDLQRLTDAFEAQRLGLAAGPEALEPEQVLVLEIAGELDDFRRAVERVPGLEFLVEEIEDKVDPDEFAVLDRQGRTRPYARQLFLVASDHTAWGQLLGLWGRYQRDETLPRGLTPFRHLFEQLRELRPWDDRDRLERTGAAAAWEAELTGLRDELVEFEVELWLRTDLNRRAKAVSELREDLESAGGALVAEHVHPEIDYHGVLGRVPAHRLIEAVQAHDVRWLRTVGIRFFHPVGQMAATGEAGEPAEPVNERGAAPQGQPQVAVLDGLPLGGHTLLRGRVVVDDPDGWEETIPAARRRHGTGTASIVIHGDLGDSTAPLSRPVYVRPILTSDAPEWVGGAREELPRDRLAVDLVHSAVARLFEGDAVAGEVQAVVLAVGDTAQQFDRFVSPLARLLDWLAFRYEIVFLVSAGNHIEPFEIPADVDGNDPQELQHEVLGAITRTAGYRRLLAPAESVNALTVGAAHDDASPPPLADDRVDPILSSDLPNVSSATGSGHRRAVKPDILLRGGRQLVRLEPPTGDRRLVTLPPERRPPGVRMAAPPQQAGDLGATSCASGTSVAAGYAGHHAGHILETIEQVRALHGAAMPSADLDAVLVKAALLHTARWGAARGALDQVNYEIAQTRSREAVARLVGYGRATPEHALRCDDHIVTVLGAGRIEADAAHTFNFPLPASLASRTDRRRVTLTLAWLTPINPRHRFYRRAALKLEPAGPAGIADEREAVDQHGARRGTAQHDVLEGRRAVPYAPGSSLQLTVSCRADAGALDVPVPYAVLASIEVPAQAGIPVYEEVRQALRVPVAVRAART